MEENKKVVGGEKGGNSSSFISDELFGEKGGAFQPSASTGIFSSMFLPPSHVPGRNSLTNELMESLQKHSKVQEWNKEIPDEIVKNTESEKCYTPRSPIFQGGVDSCPLSSSLYYGGQEDMYSQSSSTPSFGSNNTCKKNEGEDNTSSNNQSASRGNMWEGSLYY